MTCTAIVPFWRETVLNKDLIYLPMATYSINKMVGYDKVGEFTVADGLEAICGRRFDEA